MNELLSTPQWLPVLLIPNAKGKIDKLPCDASGAPCNAHDPAVWMPYDQALARAQAWGPSYTIGFVLTRNDDFFCLDIDNARQADGTWSPLAQQLAAQLPGCMMEVSLSGTGLHIWGRYPNPPEHAKKRIDLGIELYTELRFIAWGTGHVGTMAPRCDALPAFMAAYFPEKKRAENLPADGPVPEWRGPTDDDELLRRALQSKSTASVFGGKASFADLWDNNVEVLQRCYPGDGDDGTDRSSVDAALAQHLAFWTGKDAGRMQALMLRSSLVREKWDREDYLPRTIASACAMQRDVLQDKLPEPPPGPDLGPQAPPSPAAPAFAPVPQGAPAMREVEGATFLTPAQQADVFRGCVYVLDQHRVLVPGGLLLTPDRFRAHFGGYTFAMDARNERTTRNAFEAFTESQVLRPPRADSTCFKPQLPYGAMVRDAGRVRVNTYWPLDVPRRQGDPGPFLRHLEKLVPPEYDRKVVFYKMCSLVQRQGYKMQWALLIQGTEGNGKTLLSRCVAQAIGQRYTHWPRADMIAKQFNGWMVGRTFYAVEDIALGDKHDIIEQLKPLITGGDGLEIERKGIDSTSEDICGNFIFNTNHKNALKKTRNDRRFCIIYTAQQSADDLARDGMDGDYMVRLYDWLKNQGGYEIVAELLWSTPIPWEFDPAGGMQRAPRTSSTDEAIEASLGPVEQEVMDAIEREEVGFKGGWISSGAFDRLLERIGKDRFLPRNRRRDVLQSLGYDWHPALDKGRVNNPVQPDGAKVKLFVRQARQDLLQLRLPNEVTAAYTAAQTLSLPAR